MTEAQWGFAIALLVVAFLAYGLVVGIWSISSALTPRFSKPNKNGLKSAAVWVVWTWCAFAILILGSLQYQFSTYLMLLYIPANLLASIAGAFYGNDKPYTD